MKPILFNSEMVRAVISGRKTQTRRIIKKQPHGVAWFLRAKEWLFPNVNPHTSAVCPFGEVGKRLWVRETWAHHKLAINSRTDDEGPFVYAADTMAEQHRLGDKWKPSIHMPRCASRITLEVTGVRVERLQDISEADALAEGVSKLQDASGTNKYTIKIGDLHINAPTAAEVFKLLWWHIYGDESWDVNPWVWIVEFKRVD